MMRLCFVDECPKEQGTSQTPEGDVLTNPGKRMRVSHRLLTLLSSRPQNTTAKFQQGRTRLGARAFQSSTFYVERLLDYISFLFLSQKLNWCFFGSY